MMEHNDISVMLLSLSIPNLAFQACLLCVPGTEVGAGLWLRSAPGGLKADSYKNRGQV